MSATHEEGDVIGDRYRLEEFLGEGGVAKAWRGTDTQTNQTVVVKHPNYDSDNDLTIVRESLEREMEILQSIEESGGHPNLMGLVEGLHERDQPTLVVEHVSGENLYAGVKRRNGFTNAADVRSIGVALCEAMSFLHENEIMYRDLKPDNVMLRPDLTPVLIDFNTAKGFVPDQSGGGRSGTVIPNPTYKPPELNNDPDLVGYRQGPWSDVYSIGKVLMFMFSANAARGDGVDPREFPGTRSVPAYLAESIEHATQAHKDDRYRNATVLAHSLEHRTSEPPAVASLTHIQTSTDYDVYPGDTIGRDTADGPRPSITLDDPDSYISAVQVQFDTDEAGHWLLRDRSLNGTWIARDGDWQRVLSARGRERLRERSEDPDPKLADLPEQTILRDGDRIALVHPSYEVWLQFSMESNQ
jgi:protein kinase/serine/threonine-protein kinase